MSTPSQQEASTQVEEIQKRLTTKETDLTRIRADRENLRAETTELRAKDSDKLKQVEQLKTLAQSREDRIAAFESEVRRLKMDRAAAKGDSAGVDLHANNDEADIVNDLTLRLKCVFLSRSLLKRCAGSNFRTFISPRRTAEDLLLALQDQLRSYAASANAQDGATFADSEMAARKELSAAKSKLSSLEAILGPEGNVELRELKERVEEREKRLSVVEAQLKSQDQVSWRVY